MPTRGAAHGISPETLSRFDMSDEENVKQAEFELRRASTDFDLARWARTWGDAAITGLQSAPPRTWIDPQEAEDAEAEAKRAEASLTELRAVAQQVANHLSGTLEWRLDQVPGRIETAITKLESAL